jgi:hypothetical protein
MQFVLVNKQAPYIKFLVSFCFVNNNALYDFNNIPDFGKHIPE